MTAAELRESRQKLGLTQKQMAETLQTPFRTYQDWEMGRPKIPGVVSVAIKCLTKKKKAQRPEEAKKMVAAREKKKKAKDTKDG